MTIRDTLFTFLAAAKSAGCLRITVAYSGGIDSHVLLYQLSDLLNAQEHETKLLLDAIYINHHIQNQSTAWGVHCREVCLALGVKFREIEVDAIPKKGESPEQKARLVRYQALASVMDHNHWLVTAQHSDDQAETVMLQLLRGSGVNGLSAMPESRPFGKGFHYRPLLTTSQRQIEIFADENNLVWIEDPSNQDQKVSRNFLRKSVMPPIKEHWPQATTLINKSAAWMAEASELMAEVAENDLSECIANYGSLNITSLKKLTLTRQKNMLRQWFHQLGLKRPGSEKLNIIIHQIIDAREDANPQLNWQGTTIRRYQKNLYCLNEWQDVTEDWRIEWDGCSTVQLANNWASLTTSKVYGSGLSTSILDGTLSLQIRKGGEQCHPVSRHRNRTLKKLFQEYSIPPWLRERWPLLYCADELVAVPGLFICKGYEASSSEEGLAFCINYQGMVKTS